MSKNEFSPWFKRRDNCGEIEVSDAMVHGGEHEQRKLEVPIGLDNLFFFVKIIFLSFLIIFLRTSYLQIVKNAYFTKKAENNKTITTIIPALRGIITDRRGKILVKNIASFDAIIQPTQLPHNQEKAELMIEKCFLLINFKNSQQTVKHPSFNELQKNLNSPFLVKTNLTNEEVIAIDLFSKKECPFLKTLETAIREYEDGPVFSHIMGYTGKIRKEDLLNNSDYLMTDYVGRSGIEEALENELKGEYGYRKIEIETQKNIEQIKEEKAPIQGNKITLSIDYDLQNLVFNSFEELSAQNKNAINETENQANKELPIEKGAAVFLDPENGEILSLVSFPSFNNNLFAQTISESTYQELVNNPNKPLLNRAIAGTYPPGSTIKPLIGIAALENNIINPKTSFNCEGILNLGQWSFRDWKKHGPNINLEKAIAESCDVFFYIIGGGYGDFSGLGVLKIEEFEKKMGLGEKTGIELKGEQAGFIPTPEWKKKKKGENWYIGNTYHIAIGQGDILTTPIQIANYIASIGNGGKLLKPHLVKKIEDKEGNLVKEIGPEILREDFIAPNNLMVIKNGMQETISTGTAQMLKNVNTEICGKTGTAQIGGTEKTHSWFTGFAPCDNPKLAFAIIVEEGGEATDSAVPITKKILEEYFGKKNKEE